MLGSGESSESRRADGTTAGDFAVVFLDLIARRLPPGARLWLGRSSALMGEFEREEFLVHFASTARLLGRQPLSLDGSEGALLARHGHGDEASRLSAWGLDEAGRTALLLLAGAQLGEAAFVSLAGECYRHGDNRERQAVVRSLPLLPATHRFLFVAADANRSHVRPVFESLACDNAWPARFLPELDFNQMVIKTVYLGLAVSRIVGLAERLSPSLRRLVDEHAAERVNAGRAIPADLDWLQKQQYGLLQ